MTSEAEGELVGDDVDDNAIRADLCGCGFDGCGVGDKRCQADGQGWYDLLVLVMVEVECEDSVGCTHIGTHVW